MDKPALCRSCEILRQIAIRLTPHIVARRMKNFRVTLQFGFFWGFLCSFSPAFAGADASGPPPAGEDLTPPQFEVSVESAYLLGFINARKSTEIAGSFVAGRVRSV